MRHLFFKSMLLCLLALTMLPFCAAQDASANELIGIEKARTTALEHSDIPALDKLLRDDLTYVHASGMVDTKASFLQAIRSGDLHYLAWTPRTMHVRMLGDGAVLDGEYTVRVINRRVQPDPLEMNIFFISVSARQNGKWQQIAWQSTKDVAPAAGK